MPINRPSAYDQLIAVHPSDIAAFSAFTIATTIYRGCDVEITCARIVAMLEQARGKRELSGGACDYHGYDCVY